MNRSALIPTAESSHCLDNWLRRRTTDRGREPPLLIQLGITLPSEYRRAIAILTTHVKTSATVSSSGGACRTRVKILAVRLVSPLLLRVSIAVPNLKIAGTEVAARKVYAAWLVEPDIQLPILHAPALARGVVAIPCPQSVTVSSVSSRHV